MYVFNRLNTQVWIIYAHKEKQMVINIATHSSLKQLIQRGLDSNPNEQDLDTK